MLRSLHIENIAVVKSADVEFNSGMTVLTGETGAGKSVIIDSINMLTGAKVSRDIIRSGEEHALSEAVFDDVPEELKAFLSELGVECEDGEVIITHKLTYDGRSSIRVNGRTVTKAALKDISKQLISIHGQHDNRELFNKSSYTDMTDSYGDCWSLGEEYREIYRELDSYRKKLAELNSDEEEKARRKDILEYQIKDIDSKKLKDGEKEALEAEKLRLANIEKINKHINFAYRALCGGERGGDVAYLLSRASDALKKITDVVPDTSDISEKLTDMSYEVSDLADRIKALSSDDGEDPEKKLDKIESRLEVISALKRRYGRDIKAILEFRDNAVQELDDIELSDERAEQYREIIAELEARAKIAARVLSEHRKVAASEASVKIMDVLSYLDMPKVKFEISVNELEELTPTGRDRIEFLTATNPGEPMMPMSEIASGGEMARIMLAIKSVLNEKDGVGCAVYDEIDTGISGKTSRKIGVKLKEIAGNSQILCVTHSAQIATLADNHYLISKKEVDGRAHTSIRLLDRDERIEEAARILGGINITEAQRQAARDMLDDA